MKGKIRQPKKETAKKLLNLNKNHVNNFIYIITNKIVI